MLIIIIIIITIVRVKRESQYLYVVHISKRHRGPSAYQYGLRPSRSCDVSCCYCGGAACGAVTSDNMLRCGLCDWWRCDVFCLPGN